MRITVTVHDVYNNENSKVKGIASAAFGGQFAVHGITIIEGKNGLFASMPQKMNDNGDYFPMFNPVTKEARIQLNKAVLDAYEQKLEDIANGEVESDEEEVSEDDDEDFEEAEKSTDDLEVGI